jgi:HEAT repeat protein
MGWPRLRLRFRTLLALVACFAVGCWVWVNYFSPTHRWYRTIRSDQESGLRWEAASRAIKGEVPGVSRAEAISALRSALTDPSPRIRQTSAHTLGQLRGPEALMVVPSLALVCKDADDMARYLAVQSLCAIATRETEARPIAVPVLLEALKDRRSNIRLESAVHLVLMGRPEPAIPVLEAILRDGQDIYGMAALAMGLCGSRDERSVEVLKSAAKGSSDPKIRRAAAEALDRLADSPRRPVP